MLWSYISSLIVRWEWRCWIWEISRSQVLEGYAFNWAHPAASKMSKPILLRECISDFGAIPFWFYHSWFGLPGFYQMVIDSWNSLVLDDNNDQGRVSLRTFYYPRPSLWESMKLLHDFQSLINRDNIQKAKIRWAIEGDENSKFFHAIINKKRANLSVKGVMVDGECQCYISQDNSLWARVISALHGSSSQVLAASFSSLWKSILNEVKSLKAHGVDLISHCKIRVGNGMNTSFWNDCWIGDSMLKHLFPRLFALETIKDISVADKFRVPITCSFRRPVRGGLEAQQLDHLMGLIESTLLSNSEDRWVWDLNGDGIFCVKDVRNLLDETFLPKADTPTRWIKCIPIKVNVFVWKALQDRLPTRSNLVRRNILIDSLSCPICDGEPEDSSHLFFRCCLARDVTRLVCRWWDLDFHSFNSYTDWQGWFKQLRLGAKSKEVLEGVFYVSWWSLWNFRNHLLFADSNPRKDAIFDEIVLRSFNWCLARGNRTLNWASSQWNVELASALMENGFSQSKRDYSLYTKSNKGEKGGLISGRRGQTDGGWRRMETAAATETMILFVLHPPMMVCVMIDIPFHVDYVSKKAVMLYACLSPSHVSSYVDMLAYQINISYSVVAACGLSKDTVYLRKVLQASDKDMVYVPEEAQKHIGCLLFLLPGLDLHVAGHANNGGPQAALQSAIDHAYGIGSGTICDS
ncbi:RNA-directed DNA polymerase, eukaryota [Tanacetum coccineum]